MHRSLTFCRTLFSVVVYSFTWYAIAILSLGDSFIWFPKQLTSGFHSCFPPCQFLAAIFSSSLSYLPVYRLATIVLLTLHANSNFLAGREEWASRREAEAEGREREPGAANKDHKRSSELHAAPSCHAGRICRPGPIGRSQAGDACDRLPGIPYVAVHAPCRCRHLAGRRVLPSSGLRSSLFNPFLPN